MALGPSECIGDAMSLNAAKTESLSTFEASALPHATDLFRTATSLLGNRTEAEDAVQETYLQAWKSFHRFTPGTNCRAWLYRVLFHVIAHQRRKWLNRFIPTERADMEQNHNLLRSGLPIGTVMSRPQQSGSCYVPSYRVARRRLEYRITRLERPGSSSKIRSDR